MSMPQSMQIYRGKARYFYRVLEAVHVNLPGLCAGAVLVYFYIMMETSDLFALLDGRRAELGLSQAEVGRRAFGQADGSALQNIRRGSSPTFEKLQRLCEVLGIDVSLTGPSAPSLRPKGPTIDGFAQIPLHSASLSAGHGHENHSEGIVDYLAFRRDWLRRIGVSPSSAVLARADGDSMQPTIWHNDLVLIDRTRADLPVRKTDERARRSSIFALIEDGQARIKRVERPSEGELLLLSDNPDYGPQFARSDEISIIGKVMWWGHTNRE